MFTTWLIYVLLVLFLVAVVALWLLNFVGLPGNWCIVALAAVWVAFGPERFYFSWTVVIVLLVLAGVGELLEFLASMAGAKKVGGSSRSAVLSVVGAIIGGIVGAVVGLPIPIPLIGVLISALLCAAIGALVGAVIGERWIGKSMEESLAVGKAAFWGRLLGTVGKITVGSGMVLLALIAPFVF